VSSGGDAPQHADTRETRRTQVGPGRSAHDGGCSWCDAWHSARIVGDACEKLRRYSIEGTELDQDKVTDYVGQSLMLFTALSPHTG